VANIPAIPTIIPVSTSPKVYVASKTGKAYYLPSCAAANRIKEENKVWFSSQEGAEKAGYTKAANCPGL
jgi:methylphosphotriester-DNA--protein-cysteine methyltransferase